MKKEKAIGPAPYTHTDGAENLAVATFVTLLDNEKIKADIKTRDKFPNIDGYLELVDETFRSIGKLETQVKTLPIVNIESPKIKIETTFFSYCEESSLPVILVGVDTENKKAYWLFIDKNFTSQLKIRAGQKSKTVHFLKENIIDGQNTEYILLWKDIIESHKTKLQEYDKLKESHDILFRKSNPALGLVENKFQNIHLFLNELNKFLNNEFFIVKKRYYPDAWSIGMAYYKYEGGRVSYTLYPIPLNKNDVQIKVVNEELHRQLEEEGLGFTNHYTENPIEVRPKEYAREIIQSKTLRLLENRLLEHQGNQFLAREFIIGFIDKFYIQIGLEKKKEYTLEEVEKAFFHYLPIWVNEAVDIIVNSGRNNRNKPEDCLHRDNAGRILPYFDPDDLAWHIMSDELDTINGNVAKRLDQEKINVPQLRLDNDWIPFGIFTEFFSFLKNQGVKKIERVYFPKNYSRLRRGNEIWNYLSPEAVEKILKTFFENLPYVYYDLLSLNFPLLKDNLPIFRDVSRILIAFDVNEEYTTHHDAPKIQIFYLKNREESGIKIEVFPKSENRVPDMLSTDFDFEKGVDLDGRKYEIISAYIQALNFMCEDLPMFNYVYKMLEDSLKTYLAV